MRIVISGRDFTSVGKWAICMIAMVSLGCGLGRSPRQDKIASAHVAVLSVGEWDNYVQAVQPTFDITPGDALAAAIPNTRALEEKLLHTFALRGKVALPGTTFVDKTTFGQTDANPATKTRDRTETTESGDIAAIEDVASAAGERTASTVPGAKVLEQPLGTDPMLRYWAATAIYQEVQLLNRYLKDAAITENYRPYVIRLQITLMPRKRNQAYDADTIISFFQGDFGPNRADDTKKNRSPQQRQQQQQQQAPRGATGTGTSVAAANAGAPANGSDNDPSDIRIVPLLVTDDLEATLHSRSVDELRELSLALAAAVGGVGIGGELQDIDEKLRTVLGRDLNSTFTVARVADNTLRCRFGARQQSATELAMIPQTHNVSLLVLVPDEKATSTEMNDRTVRLACRTQLIDAATGEIVNAPGRAEFYEAVADILKRHDVGNVKLKDTSQKELVEKMVRAVAKNDFEQFKTNADALHKKFEPKDKEASFPEAIWADMVAVRNQSQFATATFHVPQRPSPRVPADQVALLMDDGKKSTIVTVRGGSGVIANQLSATLVVGGKRWYAGGIRVTDGGREVQLVFPSIKAAGIPDADAANAKLTLTSLGTTDSTNLPKDLECLNITKPPAVPGFAMSMPTNHLLSSNGGTGKVSVTLASGDPASASVLLAVSGANVESVAVGRDMSAVRKDGAWLVTGFGEVTFSLSNVVTNIPVEIVASDPNTQLSSQTRLIVFGGDASPQRSAAKGATVTGVGE